MTSVLEPVQLHINMVAFVSVYEDVKLSCLVCTYPILHGHMAFCLHIQFLKATVEPIYFVFLHSCSNNFLYAC